MRKRVPVVLGGCVLLIAASQFLDFNLNLGLPNADPPEPNSAEKPATDAAGESTQPDVMESLEEGPAPVVDVVIDGESYLVAKGSGREDMSLDEIIVRVAMATGDVNGIKIRIARTPEAIAATEVKLMRALRQAEVADDAIDSRKQLVEVQ